jgi:hypothetical protein
MALDAEFTDVLTRLAGPLLLLGLVFRQKGHHRAASFLAALIDLIPATQSTYDLSSETVLALISKDYGYATETLILDGCRIVRMPNLSVARQDVIAVLQAFIVNVRLLPNQDVCIPEIPRQLSCFTPYQFLQDLMRTTEAVGEDDFEPMANLWSALLASADHSELIPLFLLSCPSAATKEKLFSHLLISDAVNITKRLSQRCSFAYYCHVTNSLFSVFVPEKWILNLLCEAFRSGPPELDGQIPSLLPFVALFAEDETRDLLRTICRRLEVEFSGSFAVDLMSGLVHGIVNSLKTRSEGYIEVWGHGLLKWLFGSRSLKFAVISLSHYNQILVPCDDTIIKAVCKTVAFHLVNSEEDAPGLAALVAESFKFYAAVFQGNEEFAFSYVSSFLDCRFFLDFCSREANQLLTKCFSSEVTCQRACENIMPILRVGLPFVESNVTVQSMVSFLLAKSSNPEFMATVAPIVRCFPELFPSFVLKEPSETESVNNSALLHFCTFLDTASPLFLNSIFVSATAIVSRGISDEVRGSVAKLFKWATKVMLNCPAAVDFVCAIAEKDCLITTTLSFDCSHWDRSVADVLASLAGLFDVDQDKVVTLTDLGSLQVAASLLTCREFPKILPFAAQAEMLNGMMQIEAKTRSKLSTARKSASGGLLLTRSPSCGRRSSVIGGFDLSGVGPLKKPKQIFVGGGLFGRNWEESLILSPVEFLRSESA